MKTLLLTHAAATWAMVGLIMFVQIVHYPLFDAVAPARFVHFEARHQALTTLVVVPLMCLELVTALGLLFIRPPSTPGVAVYVSFGLLVLIWTTTFFVSVPLHARLSLGFDAETLHELVMSNWIRTAAWSARGLIALLMLHRALR
jgi:hypothetical protein